MSKHWYRVINEFKASYQLQALELAVYIRDHAIPLTLKDIKSMGERTRQGLEWTSDHLPASVAPEHRESITTLLNAIAEPYRQQVKQQIKRKARLSEARREIPAEDRARLWKLVENLFTSMTLKDEDRKQAELGTLKSIKAWLSMTPEERLAWFERVEGYQKARESRSNSSANFITAALERSKACALLSVPVDATPEHIRKAYRLKAKMYHPDLGGDVEKFKAIQKAYETLMRA